MRAPSTPRAPAAVTVAAHTPPPQQQPRPQRSTARARATLRAARTARARIAPPPAQCRRAPRHRTPRTNDDTRRRKDAACPHGHKAEDADRWGKRKLGGRPGNGAPLRARAASFFLPRERGLNSHTDVATRPHLSLAFYLLLDGVMIKQQIKKLDVKIDEYEISFSDESEAFFALFRLVE